MPSMLLTAIALRTPPPVARGPRRGCQGSSIGGQMMVGRRRHPQLPTRLSQCLSLIPGAMKNDQILSQITAFCRSADMAESTFGRRAVNDGKLVHDFRRGEG